ncbi:hypothetical protein K501DRAFT_141588, partial [Backusella circina FSU 941]
RELDLPTSTVNNIVSKYRKEKLTSAKSSSGRPPVPSNRDGRTLALSVRRDPTDPMGNHSQNLVCTGSVVSLPTII